MLVIFSGDVRFPLHDGSNGVEQCTISETGVHLQGMLIPF